MGSHIELWDRVRISLGALEAAGAQTRQSAALLAILMLA